MVTAEYIAKCKAEGRCIDCKSPAKVRGYCLKHYYYQLVRDRRYYSRHREQKIQKVAERKKRYKAEGRCITCGCILIEDEKTLCVNCNEATRI